MKFLIITHAEHKVKQDTIYAYKPYVKEMNVWLKYVDEVEIVAPISNEEISVIDSRYHLSKRHSLEKGNLSGEDAQVHNLVENVEHNRYSALDAESHNDEMLKQVQHDEALRHSERSEAISSEKQITTSHTPRNDKTNRHSLEKGNLLENDKQILSQVRNDVNIKLTKIPSFDITSLKKSAKALLVIPKILWSIYKAMQQADHIHVRCPGNIGLLGALVQILFPSKPKTVKYAGNWDPKSKQPISYRFQKWIVSNTFLTKNCKVLVYGNWPNQSKNIIPFFTASYSKKEVFNQVGNDKLNRHSLEKGNLFAENTETSYQVGNDKLNRHSLEKGNLFEDNTETSYQVGNDENNRHSALDTESHQSILKFLFVGGLTPGKQPLLSVQVVHQLLKKGVQAQLNIYGEGKERKKLENFIEKHSLQNSIFLHGNQPEDVVKEAYNNSHFLLFISKSEGWPKVVAEAMFWGCVPITSNVSCLNEMLGNGTRGKIVTSNVSAIIKTIEFYLENKETYKEHSQNALEWSRQFTLEKFEEEIKLLLTSFP